VVYEEVLYEGYGPGGVAVLVECMTDNRNRTVADVRHFFSKSNGNLGENGCVAWMFEKKGLILVDKETISEDDLMEAALEAGADDVIEEESEFQVITGVETFSDVTETFEENGACNPRGSHCDDPHQQC
jgi:YebC/PmpR family DNA-binding regulatory protein